MSEEEQIIYDEIIKLFTENKFLSINGTPMTLNEVNNYITNLQQENKQLKSILTELEKYINKTKLEEFEKVYGKRYGKTFTQAEVVICNMILNKIQELKEKYK